MLRRHGRTVLAQPDGTWFLATVGLQSLTLTVTATRPDRPRPGSPLPSGCPVSS
jgi:hypothetical protein